MLRIVACGEVLWDFFPTGRVLGGAPLNFVYRLNNIGHHGRVASAVGDDPEGTLLRDAMAALSMETELVQTAPGRPTGRVDIRLDEAKNPTYTIAPGVAYEFVRAEEALLDAAARSDCFCFSTLAQRNPVFRETIGRAIFAARRDVLYDVNLREGCYAAETVQASLEQCTLLKMNEDEVLRVGRIVFGAELPILEILDRLLGKYRGLRCSVVTLGPAGCLAFDRAGKRVYSPGFEVKLVDPCGAGDSFAAGFVSSLLSGEGLDRACEVGNALGALTSAQNGATTPLQKEDIAALLDGGGRRTVERTYQELAGREPKGVSMSGAEKRMSFREVFGNLNYTEEELMSYPDVAKKDPPVWPPPEKKGEAAPEAPKSSPKGAAGRPSK